VDWLYSLKVFTVVAETGKMTTAGDSVFLTQPAVSMQIKLLEDFYDVKFFDRYPAGLKLTKEGEVLYLHAKKIINTFDEMNVALKVLMSTQKHTDDNKISIGSCILISETYMPWLMQDFLTKNPNISISCTTADYQTNIQYLLEGRLDATFVGHKSDDNGSENKLKFEKFIRENLEIVVPQNYNLQNHRDIDIKFLMENHYIALRTECGISCIFKRMLAKYNLKLEDFKVRATFCSGSPVKQAVTSGFGWTILPRNFILKELTEGVVHTVKLAGQKHALNRWLYLVYPRSKEKVLPLALFLQFMRSMRNNLLSFESFQRDILAVKEI